MTQQSDGRAPLTLRISGFRIQNFGPFVDSEFVELHPGLTFVVGANNAGKSFALKGLWMREALPHVRADRTTPPIPPTLSVRMRTSAREALSLLGVQGGLWVPHCTSLAPLDAEKAFREHLSKAGSFEIEAQFPNGSPQSQPYYANPPYPGAQQWMWVHANGNTTPQGGEDVIGRLGIESNRERDSIFYFDARRTDFAKCPDSGVIDIGSNGAHLATAIAQRQGNQPKFAAYWELVQRVVPDLPWISAETSNGEARLSAWLEPPGVQSGEQRMSLSECGAGVGHVLALIYVAFYEKNRTLLIDEPQAYLHPRACRELIRVFQDLKEHGHRFVIATHSMAMLSEAMPANVIEVQREKGRSTLHSTSARTMREACAFLPIVGARWSDVFGPDRLVWVEGETEAACYPILLQGLRSQHSTTFVPLHATGDIAGKKGDKAKQAFEIYSKVTKNLSLTAQRCLILLDSEALSEEERKAISSRLPAGALHFAPYRMFEDMLLDEDAIASRLWRLLEDAESAPNLDDVQSRVSTALNGRQPGGSAARHLERIYADVSNGRVEYRKIEEGVALTTLILDARPEHFEPLTKWLVETLGLQR